MLAPSFVFKMLQKRMQKTIALNPLICWFLYIYIYAQDFRANLGSSNSPQKSLCHKKWQKSKPLVTRNWQFSSSASFVGGLFDNQLGIEMLIMGMSPEYKHDEKKEYCENHHVLGDAFCQLPKKKGGIVHGTTPERRLQINTWEQKLILSDMASNIPKNFYSTPVWQGTERRNQQWWKKANIPH